MLYVATRYGLDELVPLLFTHKGLAVTQRVLEAGEKRSENDYWNITHLNTGWALAMGFDALTARRLVRRLGPMANWNRLTFDDVVRLRRKPGRKGAAMLKAIAEARKEAAK
jgi:hypothetical protein